MRNPQFASQPCKPLLCGGSQFRHVGRPIIVIRLHINLRVISLCFLTPHTSLFVWQVFSIIFCTPPRFPAVMRAFICIVALAPLVVAIPYGSHPAVVLVRAEDPSSVPDEQTIFTLPCNDKDPVTRTSEIEQKQAQLLYGPSLLGNTAPFPAGPLGNNISERDQKLWGVGGQTQSLRAYADAAKVAGRVLVVSTNLFYSANKYFLNYLV